MYKIRLAYNVSNILSSNHTAQKKICPHKSSSWPSSLPQPVAAILASCIASLAAGNIWDLTRVYMQQICRSGSKTTLFQGGSICISSSPPCMQVQAFIHSLKLTCHTQDTANNTSLWSDWQCLCSPYDRSIIGRAGQVELNSTAREKGWRCTDRIPFWKQACIHSHQWPKTLCSPLRALIYISEPSS